MEKTAPRLAAGLLAALLLLLPPGAEGAPEVKVPSIGYLYAAGGRQGTRVTIVAAGQNLRGPRDVRVTGEGVSAKVLRHLPPQRIRPEQLQLLGRKLRECRSRIVAEMAREEAGEGNRRERPRREDRRKRERPKPERPKPESAKDAGEEMKPEETLPEHPLLEDLESLDLRELKKVADVFFDPHRRVQASAQIAEGVEIEISIERDAPPGVRELRVRCAQGLSNPLPFLVGVYPEVMEDEINDFEPQTLPAPDPAFVLNGQITVHDVDRFRFSARRGQRLVFQTEARSLVPYMADAVPGWFQAVLVLRDAGGREVAFADDFRFDPDPVLTCEIPETGEYDLEVRDAIWRGREDFVYRITLGEQPFVSSIFPLGGREGAPAEVAIEGWNLREDRLPLDTGPGRGARRALAVSDGKRLSNSVAYAVDPLPDALEAEPNDTVGTAQAVSLPLVVNGRIDAPGDVDVFRFEGRAGQEIAIEVVARRLGSPLDSLVELTDARGRTLALDDDYREKAEGLMTHSADSCLLAALPGDGTYCVRLRDAQQAGGPAYAYRLRISPPRPDFAVYVVPSALNLTPGTRAPVTVHAERRDGFAGPIDLAILDAPPGTALSGGRIPAGRDRVRVILTAPATRSAEPFPLRIVARAGIGGGTVTRPAIAADDLMQAFLWRHLVPARELLVCPGGRAAPASPVELTGAVPVPIPLGGTARVLLRAPGARVDPSSRLVLSEPPPGIVLRDVGAREGGVFLNLKAEKGAAKAGDADNLILEMWRSYEERGKDGKPTGKVREYFAGYLPAIPIEVVAPRGD